jgi:hypothetical protein
MWLARLSAAVAILHGHLLHELYAADHRLLHIVMFICCACTACLAPNRSAGPKPARVTYQTTVMVPALAAGQTTGWLRAHSAARHWAAAMWLTHATVQAGMSRVWTESGLLPKASSAWKLMGLQVVAQQLSTAMAQTSTAQRRRWSTLAHEWARCRGTLRCCQRNLTHASLAHTGCHC